MSDKKSKNGNESVNLCQELEACRNLRKQLTEEARHRSPFSEEYVSVDKLSKYVTLLQRLQGLYETEETLLQGL